MLNPAVKSFAFVAPAPWAPVAISWRTSHTLTAAGETPVGTAPFAVMVPTGLRMHWICSKPVGAPDRMSVLPVATAEGNSRAKGDARLGERASRTHAERRHEVDHVRHLGK